MVFERIRNIREDNDLKQTQIASFLNIDQRTYSRYERGEITISAETLCKLADFYRTSLDYLAERTDEKRPYPPSKIYK